MIARLILPGLATALLLSGCVESALNPTDQVEATGQALLQDKSPLAEATLNLARSANSACIGVTHFKEVTTDAQGAFAFELTGEETQNGENARCFQLSTPTQPQGASVLAQFLVQVTGVEVPSLQVWNGGTTVTAQQDGVEVGFDALSGTHGFEGAATLAVANGSGTAWEQTEAESPIAVSAHSLEDFDGLAAQLVASHEVKGSGTTFTLVYSSDRASIARGALTPVSRGMACQTGSRSYDAGECPYTDGALAEHLVEGDATELRVTLAQATQLKAAVLRGFQYNVGASKVLIEGSADDGVNWITLGELPNAPVSNRFAELELASAAPAVKLVRVRVEGTNEPKLVSLRELSLFQ